jgi:hypothetical protein
MKMCVHDLYCLNCGNRSLPVYRNRGSFREKFHRKKLYCLNCKAACNHVEIKNSKELLEFKKNFEAGEFKEEAAASILEVEREESIYDL